ncbi:MULTISPECIES: glycosyltransferase family 1 protein [unclassified Streptomyces]|uniref:glycosyltransferase family 1 protein n=1 Tax=unclassified Streptomyces TaxID=2593676 RepID=UPI0008DE74DA|nr:MULTISPECIES: glycosyltransferase family 1 protein [unclassified Streptomyces]OII63544.1 glycosyl transferase [Streptomyces sp. CC77]
MTRVLFIASAKPQFGVFADSVRKFRAQGAQTFLAGTFHMESNAEALAATELDGTHQLPRSLTFRSAAVRRKASRSPLGMRVWLQSKGDGWLRQEARRADILVALDPGAVYTVWRLAQHYRIEEAHFGIAPALKAVGRLKGKGATGVQRGVLPPLDVVKRDVKRSVDGLPAAVMRRATARPVMRSAVGARMWRTAVTAPGVPAKVRIATSRYVAEGMQWAGRTSGAALALAAAAAKIPDQELKAQLLDEAVMKELGRGINPRDLGKAVSAQLTQADARFAVGDHAKAAAALDRALFLAFHRVLHIDQLSSPLAKNAEGFVAPLYRSAAVQALSRPQGRKSAAAAAPTDRPLRLLVTTSANANFLGNILDRYRDHPDVELRFLDLATQKALKRIAWAGRLVLQDRLSGGTSDYQEEVERLMRPYLDWADTVFVDWAVGPAAMLTTIDPGTARIVVRLHSYEAFTRWPHMTDFSRIDDLVYVAPHVRDLVESLVPQLRGDQAPRTHLLDNAMDLSGFVRPKPADARFNLGLVGISQVAKDPMWAVDVLNRVRQHDERYRLLLVGGDMNAKTSRATHDYLRQFRRELKPLVESGAVLKLGPTDDVPSALTDIGVILSSSVREGCHVGLMEGAASGAVPVSRDWPFYAGKPNSARTLYPEGWVVGSAEEAAQRILKATATEESWREAGKLASEHALSAWDWPVVAKQFDELFLGER